MAHFAKLDSDNTVLEVNVVSNETLDEANEEASGIEFLTAWSGGYPHWRQTSYTSVGGDRINPDTGEIIAVGDHFRFNYAGIGYRFDPDFGPDGAFIPPQPFPSWTLNPDTALWDAPVPMPAEGGPWRWDEDTLSWVEVTA